MNGSWYESRGETFVTVTQATDLWDSSDPGDSDSLAPWRIPRLLEQVQEPLSRTTLNRLGAIPRKQALRYLMKTPLT